ncbi:MAG: hypothetical protein ACQES3_04890 [Pseudomonadota bacterium]
MADERADVALANHMFCNRYYADYGLKPPRGLGARPAARRDGWGRNPNLMDAINRHLS